MRNTPQKEAIRNVFNTHDRPLAVKDILKLAQEVISSTNIATVYRNLNHLVEEGWLTKIDFPPLGTYYERSGKSHHHFFYCRKCKIIYSVPGCSLKLPQAVPTGFVHEDHDVFIRGLCNKCSESY